MTWNEWYEAGCPNMKKKNVIVDASEIDETLQNEIYKIAMKVKETEDAFYFQKILPYCTEVMQTEVSKEMLVDALRKADKYKWIQCSERLPELYEDVLVQTIGGCMLVGNLDERYEYKAWYIWGDEWLTLDEVLAWMPLPEAYEDTK